MAPLPKRLLPPKASGDLARPEASQGSPGPSWLGRGQLAHCRCRQCVSSRNSHGASAGLGLKTSRGCGLMGAGGQLVSGQGPEHPVWDAVPAPAPVSVCRTERTELVLIRPRD